MDICNLSLIPCHGHHLANGVQKNPSESESLVGIDNSHRPLRFEGIVIGANVPRNGHSGVGLLVFDLAKGKVVVKIDVEQVVFLRGG